MKMFFAVFFGAFCAIMAAAATLYFIKEYHDTESARQILRETATASERLNTTYGARPAQPRSETVPNDSSAELRDELMLVKAVTIKTADGDFTIPAGKTVHTVHEKAAPGTVHINYEGYTFAIPLSAVAPDSQ